MSSPYLTKTPGTAHHRIVPDWWPPALATIGIGCLTFAVTLGNPYLALAGGWLLAVGAVL